MNRRKFFSLVGAAAAAASIPSLARSATPAPILTDPIPEAKFLYAGSVPACGPQVVDWKVYYRGVVLNEDFAVRIGEQMRDTLERNALAALTHGA